MLAPLAVHHMDLALRDSVSVGLIGQARTAVISWSLPMVMQKTTLRLINASMIAPKEGCASLGSVSVRRVGQASHAMWQPSVQRIATTLRAPALSVRASVQLASLDLPVVTKNVQRIVLVMEIVLLAPVVVLRAG
jgi:hypothetical protein